MAKPLTDIEQKVLDLLKEKHSDFYEELLQRADESLETEGVSTSHHS